MLTAAGCPGRPNTGTCFFGVAIRPTMSGFPGLIETPCTSTPGLPASLITFAVRSAIPTELPPVRRTRAQSLIATSSVSLNQGILIRDDPQPHWHTTCLGDQAFEIVGITVPDAARCGVLSAGTISFPVEMIATFGFSNTLIWTIPTLASADIS